MSCAGCQVGGRNMPGLGVTPAMRLDILPLIMAVQYSMRAWDLPALHRYCKHAFCSEELSASVLKAMQQPVELSQSCAVVAPLPVHVPFSFSSPLASMH